MWGGKVSTYLNDLFEGKAAYPVIYSTKYRVSLSGTVFDGTVEITSRESSLGPVVTLDWWDGHRDYLVAEVLGFSIFNLAVPTTHWHDITVTFKDGNRSNVAATNLYIYFKRPIECLQYPGYFYIPNFSYFACNEKAEVISLLRGTPVPVQLGTTSPEGHRYRFFSLRTDTSAPKTISRHRCLLMSVYPYPENALELEVNHINLVPGDDRKDNLEWVTKGENVSHGKAMRKAIGKELLSNRAIAYQIRDLDSGNVEVMRGKEAIRRRYGITTGTLKAMIAKGITDPTGRLQIRKSSNEPWSEPTARKRITRKILVRRVDTGEIKVYADAMLAGMQYGIGNDTVRARCEKGPAFIWEGNLQFKFEGDDREWSKPVGKTRPMIGTGRYVQVRDVFTGVVGEYHSLTIAGKALGISTPAMCVYVGTNGTSLCRDRYQVRYVETGNDPQWPVLDVKQCAIDGYHRIVYVREVATGKIIRFDKQADCARELGINITTLAERLRKSNPERQFGGFQFKTEGQQASW